MSDFTVELLFGSKEQASPIKSEAVRYLGYRNSLPDDITDSLINKCSMELSDVLSPKCCYVRSSVSFPEQDLTDFGFGNIQSHALYTHLQGCNEVILMAATIGIAADRLIAKYGRFSPAKSVIIDALASSAIEHWCDNAELAITKNDKLHCSRFSAGYGDFPLSYQTHFIRYLDTSRKIGVTLSDSLLMTPTKSVTAVIGIGANSRTCSNKCMTCENVHCIYRNIT